jgi:cobalt/nickel transport system ATP-binding protein
MTVELELRSVTYHYPGQSQPALKDVTLGTSGGRRIALLGRNGSGKSTLLLACNGIVRPQSGGVYLDCRPVAYDHASLCRLRRTVGVVFQNPDDQLFSASVAEDISFGPLNLGLSDGEARDRVATAAELCEITHLLDKPTHALSGGEKTRVALAGVLAMDVEILIADEALAGLDPWMRHQVMEIFDKLSAQGKTIVLATHDIGLARAWADTVVLMEGGTVCAVQPAAVFFANPGLVARINPFDL